MDSREIILKILVDVNINGAYSNISINKHLKDNKNIENENFIREIVYGVIENKIYIDYIVSQVSKTKIERIHPNTLEILRMAVYQIIFMDKIPDRASVNEAVNLSKKYGHKGIAGFVNGILRNISRNKENLMKIQVESKIDFLSIKYSHPKWMVENWVKDYGYELAEEILKGNNSRPKLNIRVNTLKISRDKLLNILSNYGFDVFKTKYANDGIVIKNPKQITSLDEYRKGYFIIQDESSILVSQIIEPKEGTMVLDLCSAPGGKSTHMGQLMKNNGKIISRDVYEHKLELVENNANRLDINIIETEIFDARKLDKNLIEKVDYCIIDAPCSGLGIIRRRPEIKWNRKKEDIKELNSIQWEILNNGKKYLKPGGIMVYSTCTISKIENENMVEKFLGENKDFKLINFYDKLDNRENIVDSKKGYLQLFPHIHNTDGFFIAKFKKINS